LALGHDPPSVRAYAPTRSSKSHPRAPPPDPRLKPGPVFVASGGVITVGCGVLRCVAVRVAVRGVVRYGALWCVTVLYGAGFVRQTVRSAVSVRCLGLTRHTVRPPPLP